jgi:hypothetical protein
MDLLLDANGDLVFSNGNSLVTQTQSDVVAQRLYITLNTFLGEWFLDTTIGVPYYQQIFGKVRNKSTIDIIFQNIISQDPGVLSLKSFSSDISTGRGYSMTFSVIVSDGSSTDLITVSVGS